MSRSRLVAAIWLAAAALAGVIIVLFRGDAADQAALTAGLAIAGAVVALWLLVRPSFGATAASTSVGCRVASRVCRVGGYPVWALGALVTDAFLAAAGAAAAALSWMGRPRHLR